MAFSLVTAVGLFFLAACNSHGEPSDNYKKPAHFKVTNDVVNPRLMPFAATISGFGNSFINEGSGFEPPVYRSKFIATENAPNRVVAAASALSNWDTLREGFLDGAEVHVYRIENWQFQMVRSGHIPDGGFHVSGWMPLTQGENIVSPESQRFSFRWANYNRPDAKYYFTVRAIDYNGNLSPPADAFSITRPAKVVEGAVANSTIKFKPSRLTLDSTPPPAPKNLRGRIGLDGSLVLEWDPVEARDLAGYAIYRSDYPPQAHKGYHFDFAEQATSSDQYIKAGDMVVVSKKLYGASRNRHMSNRVWGAWSEYRLLLPGLVDFFSDESDRKTWELARHESGTPVEQPGETYLKLDLAFAERTSLGIYNHSGTAQSWYPVLETKPYKVEFWMRMEGKGRARFLLTGFYHDSTPSIRPIDFQAGPEWRKYTATFTPPMVQQSDRPNQMILELTGPGTFHVDNFRVYRADLGYQEMPPSDYEELKASRMQALRTHGIVNTRFRTHDMEQLTNLPGLVGGGTQMHNTLPQILSMMRKAGVQPWLQLEFHMSPKEWLAFAEYMAAPYDPAKDTPARKPWAYKRYQQGQAKPWTDEFDRIYFELANETWNRLFHPWVFDGMTDAMTGKKYSPGQVYGMYQEYVRSILRSSPYWQAAGLDRKFAFVLGGWANQSYGRDAAAASPSSSFMTIAAYNGGWDEGEGPPGLNAPSFFNLLSQVHDAIKVGERHVRESQELKSGGHSHVSMGTYEAGPGYALNGLNNETVSKDQEREQEQVMKSLAAGTATLDSFLARAYLGFTLQNFFTFDHGTHWKSHAKWYHGGQAYPSWKLLSLFNNQATGDMLRTETISVPSVDLPAFKRRQAVQDAPLAAVYATRRGNRYAVFVVSRKVPDYPLAGDDGYIPVTIELPFHRARRVTLYRMAGNPMANNILADEVKIDKIELPASRLNRHFTLNTENGADNRGLSPAATFLYVFDGVSVEKH